MICQGSKLPARYNSQGEFRGVTEAGLVTQACPVQYRFDIRSRNPVGLLCRNEHINIFPINTRTPAIVFSYPFYFPSCPFPVAFAFVLSPHPFSFTLAGFYSFTLDACL